MIGARLGPSLPPGPELVRASRADADGGSAGPPSPFDAGRRASSPGSAGRPDVPDAGRQQQPGRERDVERPEQTGRSGRAGSEARSARPGRDADADSFERMLDRDGAWAPDAQRTAAPDTPVPPDPPPRASMPDGDMPLPPGPGREALPAQLLALLSAFAPTTAPAAGAIPAAASTGAPGIASAAPRPAPSSARLIPMPGADILAVASVAPAQATGIASAIDASSMSTAASIAASGMTDASAPGAASALATLATQSADPGPGADTAIETLALLESSPERTPETAPFPLPTAAAPPATARTAAVPMLATVALPADPQAGFDDGFGSRIVWMAEQRLGHADIRITPEHLGTIDVRLNLDGAKVSAEFYSAQPEVRQALEASFGRLREMLGQQGLQLAHADVGQQRSGRNDPGPLDTVPAQVDESSTPAPAAIRSRRLLDEIA